MLYSSYELLIVLKIFIALPKYLFSIIHPCNPACFKINWTRSAGQSGLIGKYPFPLSRMANKKETKAVFLSPQIAIGWFMRFGELLCSHDLKPMQRWCNSLYLIVLLVSSDRNSALPPAIRHLLIILLISEIKNQQFY